MFNINIEYDIGDKVYFPKIVSTDIISCKVCNGAGVIFCDSEKLNLEKEFGSRKIEISCPKCNGNVISAIRPKRIVSYNIYQVEYSEISFIEVSIDKTRGVDVEYYDKNGIKLKNIFKTHEEAQRYVNELNKDKKIKAEKNVEGIV